MVGSIPLYQHDRPNSVQMLISRVVITNNHTALCTNNGSMNAHKTLLDKYSQLSLCTSEHFPNEPSNDLTFLSQEHHVYKDNCQLSYLVTSNDADTPVLPEIMSIELEQFWMEFTGVRNSGTRPVSFVESFPVTVWLTIPAEPEPSAPNGNEVASHQPLQRLTEMSKSKTSVGKRGAVHMSVMVDIGGKVCVQLNHYQYCFIMRLADSFTEMGDTMSEELRRHKELREKRPHHKDLLPNVDTATGMSTTSSL